jgi:YidC/Oxa1 family membrane protein insertase
VLDPVYYAVSAVMWCWHQLFGLLLGPTSGVAWALSVVFLVLTLRAVMIRPFLAQVRSGRAMRALAPQLAELRKLYADDRPRLMQETKALQSAHGVSALGGCLPALLQIPVFLGLLHVLRYFNRPGLTFEQNAAIPNYVFAPDQVRSFLEARLFGAPLSAYLSMPQQLLDSFGGHVDRIDVVVVAVPLMLVAAVATHFSARHSAQQQPPGSPTASIMRFTPWIFPLGALIGGAFFPFPIAILVYWLTNNAWTLVQQRIVFTRLPDEAPQHAAVVAADAAPALVPAVARADGTRTDGTQTGGGGAAKRRRRSSGHRASRRRR